MKKILVFGIFSLILHSCSMAQPGMSYRTSDKKAVKYYEAARECWRQIDHRTGKPNIPCTEENLEKALDRDPRFLDALLLMSDLQIKKGDLNKAIEFKEKAISTDPNISSSEIFYLSLMAKDVGDYQKCLKALYFK